MNNNYFFGYIEGHDNLAISKTSKLKDEFYSSDIKLFNLLQKPHKEIIKIISDSAHKKQSQNLSQNSNWNRCVDLQPIFAAGVTFFQSSEDINKGIFEKSNYIKTYLNERPMIFFKSFQAK